MGDGLKVEISLDAFKEKEPDEKLDLIYCALLKRQHICEKRCAETDVRFDKIDNRKYVDKGFASAAGFIGGFISAWLAKF